MMTRRLTPTFHRREALMALAATLLADCALPPSKLSSGILPDPEAIRAATDPSMRLGAAGLDTATGRTVLIDGDARYAMCSTFKVPLAAAILSAVDRGELDLEEKVRFGEPDVLDYAPVIKEHLETGMLSVRALCAAAVELSDNSAANLLLPLVGGPAGLTRFMRDCGDPISRLDRLEPDLNTNLPGDLRDTTTPTTMVGLLHSLLMGEILSERSRQQLIAWMEQSKTGKGRIRAGLPAGWRVGTKSATGQNGAINDVGVFWPPRRRPILLTVFTSGGTATSLQREHAIAQVASWVASAALQGFPG